MPSDRCHARRVAGQGRVVKGTGASAAEGSLWQRPRSRPELATEVIATTPGPEDTLAAKRHWKSRLRWPRASLRTYLVAMVLVATLPLALALLYEVLRSALLQRALRATDLPSLARALGATTGSDRTALVGLAALALGLLLGMAGALLLARRLGDALDRLAEDTAAPTGEPIPVREVERLRDAWLRGAAQRRESADELAQKVQELETLFRNSPMGLVFAKDPGCSVVLQNAALDGIVPATIWSDTETQAPAPELRRDGRTLAPEERPLRRAAQHGETVGATEIELRLPGREPRFMLVSAEPLWNADGWPRGAVGAVVDITERKRAEARLRASERRLRQSQALVDLAQEVGNVGFFHYHRHTDRLTWSPGQARLFGIDAGADLRGIGVWQQQVDAAEREHVERQMRALLGARARSGTLKFPVGADRGAQRWLECRLAIDYEDDDGGDGAGDGAGALLQIVGLTIDITEQKRTEHERALMVEREQAARLEAEAANRAKDEFLAMLSHELRNPLNAIATAVEVLNRGELPAPVARSARDIIARQTRHLARMMDELLDAGRVIAEDVELLRQPVDLAALARRGVASVQPSAVAKQQTLHAEIEPAWIDADVQRIEQVLDQLLDNALKYTPSGGSIHVGLRAQAGNALLSVRDSGIGIAPELLVRIFDPFVQGARSLDRHAGGLGIGLTLVRRLVELHGGSVQAHSDAGGSVFELRLPTIAPPEDALPRSVPALLRSRVVVIDDNPDALYGLRSMLELDGHAVQTSGDGESGLAMLLRDAPDVAIVDIGLPGIDGYEVARQSRAAGYRGRLIALTGYGQERDARRSLAAGFDAHVVKPVDPAELPTMLGNGRAR